MNRQFLGITLLLVLTAFLPACAGPVAMIKPDGTAFVGNPRLFSNADWRKTVIKYTPGGELSMTEEVNNEKQTGIAEIYGNVKMTGILTEGTVQGQKIEADRAVALEGEKGKQLQTLSNGTVIEAPQQVVFPLVMQ